MENVRYVKNRYSKFQIKVKKEVTEPNIWNMISGLHIFK